jgi:hypothetical protein
MAKKDKTAKLPKKLGGVKVPKKLRKSANSALELAQNPIAREVVSAALVAGATALARRRTEKVAPPPQPDAASKVTEIGNIIAQGVAAFVSGLAKPAEKKSDAAAEPASAKPADARPPSAKPAPAAPKPAPRKPMPKPGG